MEAQQMLDRRPVSIEVHHEIEQFLYREAYMLDNELLREWHDTVLDPEIRYQMVMSEERFRKDKASIEARELLVYDESLANIDMRIRQFESGLQTMQSPQQRLRRAITNLQIFDHENEGEYLVLSNGILSRFRRLYEHEQIVYGRTDVVKRTDGGLRLVLRRIDLDERVVRNKNLLLFL